MKPILVFAGLAAAIGWLVLAPSTLDKLSARPKTYLTDVADNAFVEVDRTRLPVTPAYFSVAGRITVVVFHDATCEGCITLEHDLEDFHKLRPDVAIHKIRIPPAGKGYYTAISDYSWNIYMAPCVLIYDRNGKLLVADKAYDSPGHDLLYEWMTREAERAAKRGG